MKVSISPPPTLSAPKQNGVSTSTRGKFEAALVPTAIVVFCGLFSLWTVMSHETAASKKLISDIIAILVAAGGMIWGLWGARRALREGGDRRAALAATILSLGTGGYGLGCGVYAYYDLVLHQNPFPSWADAAYMAGYLTMMAGVLLLPGRSLPGIARLRVLLDSLMVLAALVTFSWYFALGPTLQDASQSLFGRVLGGSYPVMDLAMVLCAMVISGTSQEPRVRKVRNLLTIGIVAYVVADSGYLYQNLNGTYETGQPLDSGWMLANLLFGYSAFMLRRQRIDQSVTRATKAEEGRATGFWRSLLPYALVPAVGGLMFYIHKTKVEGALATGVYVCAGVLVGLIILRQVLAIAENSRLNRFLQQAYRELEALATTDSMTGLYNHRVFQERLREELERGQEEGTPVALILVDVDRFKQYNDSFGHPAGDQALKIVARVLKENVREGDLAARYGGEEFAAILPNTDAEEAVQLAERIRHACEATAFPNREVTLSIGVAAGTGDAGETIEQADQGLYLAKHGGRNQVVCESLLQEPHALVFNPLPEGWSVEASRLLGLERLAGLEDTMGKPILPIVRALLAMLELRDHDVETHSERVMGYCLRLAEEANKQGVAAITGEELSDLHVGALLHDIGKAGVPDAILRKPGALTEEEWAVIRRHPIEGAELLEGFPEVAGAIPVVRSHHERWDGTGYPDGLRGEKIPLAARLFALADTMDAMGSDRPYRKARSFAEIREEIVRMSGKQFDPALVKAFLAVPEEAWESMRADEEPLAKAA
jgi:diguanylate cyclase (GGDEF)-like protein